MQPGLVRKKARASRAGVSARCREVETFFVAVMSFPETELSCYKIRPFKVHDSLWLVYSQGCANTITIYF